MRMQSLLIVICFALLCRADEILEEPTKTLFGVIENDKLPHKIKDYTEALIVENTLESIDSLAKEANSLKTAEIIENKHNEIADKLNDLINILEKPQNIHTFLNLNGVDRVINNLIWSNNGSLKKQILILLKTLFDRAPKATTEEIPITLIDKLLDIFEHDQNLGLKAHVLDIMSIWLPNTPKVQARVMKLKGLELFYDQISKLDANVVYTSLDLFNRILEEHILARSTLINKDLERVKLYQKIGLVERMATPAVCNGILNIFKVVLPATEEEQLPIILALLKNIKPFCLKLFKGHNQAKSIFEDIQRYFVDPAKMVLLSNLSFNMTEVKILLENYITISEVVKDEF